MIEFKIFAPGIMILSGEYAELYGKNVVATTLNLRTLIKFSEIENLLRRICKIEFPDVGLSLNLSLEIVENFLSTYNIIGLNRERLFKYVQYFITSNGMWSTHEQRNSLKMFFFLLFYIGHREQLDIRSFCVHVTTEIPLHANLGSSTSFAVCLAACFLHWSRRQRGDHNEFNRDEEGEIAAAAMYCKKAVHNSMCLMDTYVCSIGHVARQYQLYHPGNNISDIRMTELNILLIDSMCRPNKNQTIQHVARLKCLYPEFTERCLNVINELSKNISVTLAGYALSRIMGIFGLVVLHFDTLQRAVQMNQRVLSKLNLSNQIINNISELASGCGCAKFTGVGTKKFVYILMRPDTAEQIRNIPARMEAQGLPVIVTTIACKGVKIEN